MKYLVTPAVLFGCIAVGIWPAHAQTAGPTATPTSVNFSYQVNSATLPSAAKVQVSLPTALKSLPMTVQATSSPQGWLTVTPDTGHSPLTLSVVVNPTGLTPGSYTGTIIINTIPAGSNPAAVAVTLSVSNPPSTLLVTSPSSNYTPAGPGASSPTLTFTYTTGSGVSTPASSELDVSSNGDIIPFNVTAANAGAKTGATAVWLRVNASSQLPNLQTSGVALSGSYVPITVTLDMATVTTLSPGSYGGTISVAANSAVNGSATVSVNLVVSAGPPVLTSIFPTSVIAGPVIDPVVTIYGDNFFSTSVVTLQQAGNPPITLSSQLLSRKVLQATINAAYLAMPGIWTLAVTNPAPPTNPSQAPVTTTFTVTSATQPEITSIVNAASYAPTAIQTGTSANPVPPGSSSVSPREIISIFGQNLGPATLTTATPSGTPVTYPTTLSGIQVAFLIGTDPAVYAPLIMVSSNQINAIVPVEVASVIGGSNTVSVVVSNGTSTTPAFPLTVVAEDPGAFTFGGLGQGQAAVLNFDSSSGSYTINATKEAAPRGSTILIYATGLGDLASPLANGEVASGVVTLADTTVRVDIDGQPAVVSYAGTSPGAVAGLVQINAIVPPTVRTGSSISITVSIGSASTSRRSQPGVTLCVK
ncbi:MAG TPA: hypothetical protein VG675_21845 [Bryobacteraceae bacterium]|nr:hypothetical protein [Bryobacteraceae bacterium]